MSTPSGRGVDGLSHSHLADPSIWFEISWAPDRPVGQDSAAAPMNHSNRVIFDEPAMAIGAALYAAIAMRRLGAG